MFTAELYFERNRDSLVGISPDEFVDLVKPKLEYDLSLEHIKERLDNNEILRVKMGIDPTYTFFTNFKSTYSSGSV